MADYIVKDTELTSVANAIRTAGGTNSLLSFPNGFVSAVGNISGGGGGSSDFSTAEVTLNLTPPEGVTIDWSEVFIDTGFYYEGLYYLTNAPREVTDNKTSIVLGNEGGIINGIAVSGNYYVESSEATLSGDVTFDSESHSLIITGDCTITADLLED